MSRFSLFQPLLYKLCSPIIPDWLIKVADSLQLGRKEVRGAKVPRLRVLDRDQKEKKEVRHHGVI